MDRADSTISSALGTSLNQNVNSEESGNCTSIITDLFSTILNLSRSIAHFFNDIVSYCLSFCFTEGHLVTDEQAVQTLLNTRFAGTPEEQAQAFFQGFDALSDNVREFHYIDASRYINWKEKDTRIDNLDALPVIEEALKNNFDGTKLRLCAWLVAKEFLASDLNRPTASASLTMQEMVHAGQNFINTSYSDANEEETSVRMNAILALPERIQTLLYAEFIFDIAAKTITNQIWDQICANDQGTSLLFQLTKASVGGYDPQLARKCILDSFRKKAQEETAKEIIQLWITHQTRSEAARNSTTTPI
jgi:hypothetical protein